MGKLRLLETLGDTQLMFNRPHVLRVVAVMGLVQLVGVLRNSSD